MLQPRIFLRTQPTLAVRYDLPEYGKMLYHQHPEEKLIYGPMQIEAMINQNTTISQQLSLGDQKGSKVTRGNLVAVLIGNSLLCSAPVYLTAEGPDFPKLKRVILISGDKMTMEPTLDAAIQADFGTQQPQAPGQPPSRPLESWQARAAFDRAQKAMEQGDWGTFGRAMDEHKGLLSSQPK